MIPWIHLGRQRFILYLQDYIQTYIHIYIYIYIYYTHEIIDSDEHPSRGAAIAPTRHSLMNLLVILRAHHVCKLVAAQCEKHVLLEVCCIVHLYQVAVFLTLMPRHACPLVYTTSVNLQK